MPTLRELQLGSSFRATWINSGATASPIFYRVINGSETMVGSWSAQDSGNGHYYVDAQVNSAGMWKGEWHSVVGGNSYINTEWLKVYPYDLYQQGRYISWEDVVGRYKDFSKLGGAVEAASSYISIAEARIEGRLGSKFTVPFSSNNITVRDLCTDMTYLVAARMGKEERDIILEQIDGTIERLLNGSQVMITASGGSYKSDVSGAWSSTQDYTPVFGMSDPIDWEVSSSQLYDEELARG